MGNISNGMETICKDIAAGHEDRKKSLYDVQKDVKDIKEQAGIFLGDCKKSHKEMAKNLKESLSKDREDLTKGVGLLRKDFQKNQKELRSDLAEAGKTWDGMHKTLVEQKLKKNS